MLKPKTTFFLLIAFSMPLLRVSAMMEAPSFEREKRSDFSGFSDTAKSSEQHRIEAEGRERSGDSGSVTVVESEDSSSSESMQGEDVAGDLFREKARAVGANAWDEKVQQEKRVVLSLTSSRAALEENPEVGRFVVRETAGGILLLVAEEADSRISPQRIRVENLNATRAFRAALQAEAPGVDVEDLFQVDPMKTLNSYPSLSSVKIRAALERVDHSTLASQVCLPLTRSTLDAWAERSERFCGFDAADPFWDQRETAWQRHGRAHHDLKEKTAQLEQAIQKAAEAREAHSKRDESQLGKLKSHLQNVATTLRYVPEPAAQTTATAIGTAASLVGAINLIWKKVDVARAERAQKEAMQAHEGARVDTAAADRSVIRFEEEAKKSEERIIAQKKSMLQQAAQQLHPEPTWGEYEWQRWHDFLFTDQENPLLKIDRINQARCQLPLLHQEVGSWWQEWLQRKQRQLHQFKEEHFSLLSSLQQAHREEQRCLVEKEKTFRKRASHLEEAQKKQEELKQSVESFLESSQQGEIFDQRQLNQRRDRFCNHFSQLINTTADIELLETSWQGAFEAYEEQSRQTFLSSQQLERECHKYKRLLSRMESDLQVTQEQLGKHWPEYGLLHCSFLDWELPGVTTDRTISCNLTREAFTRSSQHNAIEPPRHSERELEALGWRYFYEVDPKIKRLSALMEAPVSIPTSVSDAAKSASVSPSKTVEQNFNPYLDLLNWSREQVSTPSAQEQARWALRRELLRHHKETDRLARITHHEAVAAAGEGESFFSTPTVAVKKTEKSILSRFTLGSRNTDATSVESRSTEPRELQAEFQRRAQFEKETRQAWMALIKKAEARRRIEQGGSLGSEEEMMEAWARADDLAWQEQDERRALLQKKEQAATMEKEWSANNRRWQRCMRLEEAKKELQQLLEEQKTAAQQKRLTEAQRAQREEKLEKGIATVRIRLESIRRAWEEEAEKHASILEWQHDTAPAASKKRERALEKLQDFDRGVVRRWDLFQERAAPLDPEEAAKKEIKLYLYTLGEELDQKEREIFTLTQERPTVMQAASLYRQTSFQEALRAAREKTPGAEEAWEERVQRREKKLQESERKLKNPTTPQAEQAAIRDQIEQLRAVVVADKKAWEAFQKESNRLNRIESMWHEIEEARYEAVLQKAKHAAQHYYLNRSASSPGDLTLWNALTREERKRYNDHIDQENQLYTQEIASEERFLEEIQQRLQREETRSQKPLSRIARTLTGVQETTLQFLRETRRYYQDRFQKLQERKKAIRWARLSDVERGRIKLKKQREKRVTWLNKESKDKDRELFQALSHTSDELGIKGTTYDYSQAFDLSPFGENYHVVELYLQTARAREAQAAALEAGDAARAEIQGRIATAIRGYISYNRFAITAEKEGNQREVQIYLQGAKGKKAVVARLLAQLEEMDRKEASQKKVAISL